MSDWIPEAEFSRIQKLIPIVTVDILPVSTVIDKGPPSLNNFGLILRETPNDGRRFCLVGGRLLYGEAIKSGILRQLKSTLGKEVRIVRDHISEGPDIVAQYFPSGNVPFLKDPRQHAIGLTYIIEIKGSIVSSGEAIAFRWFKLDELPEASSIGFQQFSLIESLVRRLRKNSF